MDNLLRLVDANLNRSQEGLRVCEDIVRFILNNKRLSGSFKAQRQKIGGLTKDIYRAYFLSSRKGSSGGKVGREGNLILLRSRAVGKDVGKRTTYRESRRKDLRDVLEANIQRSKESLRVLEEITKLFSKTISERFKKIRFCVYALEKGSRVELETLLHNRCGWASPSAKGGEIFIQSRR